MTGSSEPNLNRGDADPFSHLHKMSTTAGLGSGDYVAISGTAIAAILLGVCSALVLFDSPIFLIVPLIGLIAAVAAFVQISHSNGTQTGRELAAVGLLLCLGFGGFYTCKTVYSALRNRSDEQQIVTTAHRLGELLKNQSYIDAYALMDDRFRQRVPLAQFETAWQRMSASPILGGIQRLDWNERLVFDTDAVDGSQVATGMMKLYARPAEPIRLGMAFRSENGSWLVDQIPDLYPADAPGTTDAPRSKTAGSAFIGPTKP
jgi:positive regulator of sigma E activity